MAEFGSWRNSELAFSSFNNEPSVGPIREVFPRPITCVHRYGTEHPGAGGNLDIEPPGQRQHPHDGARGRLLPINEDLEHDAGIFREVRPVVDAYDILIRTGQRNEPPVFGLAFIDQLTRSMP